VVEAQNVEWGYFHRFGEMGHGAQRLGGSFGFDLGW
jgi:hypothetical protein